MESERTFADRFEAGRFLASKLAEYASLTDVMVLALPRGGVPVGYEVARSLRAPLDVFLVRKLGLPGQEELAMGAIASGGVRSLNEELVEGLGIEQNVIDRVAEEEEAELRRRERAYRGDRPPRQLAGKRIILVDDGLATGSTMRAAAAAVRKQGPAELVIAVPVAPAQTCEQLRREVDRVICPVTPSHFYAISEWYEHFAQTTDQEVRDLLDRAAQELAGGLPVSDAAARDQPASP